MANALQNKGHANRRPAVCKKSLPTDCPIGEVILETIGRDWPSIFDWRLQGHWLIPGLTESVSGILSTEVNAGTVVVDPHVTTELAFNITVSVENPPDVLVLYCKILTPDGCVYEAAASTLVPPRPE